MVNYSRIYLFIITVMLHPEMLDTTSIKVILIHGKIGVLQGKHLLTDPTIILIKEYLLIRELILGMIQGTNLDLDPPKCERQNMKALENGDDQEARLLDQGRTGRVLRYHNELLQLNSMKSMCFIGF